MATRVSPAVKQLQLIQNSQVDWGHQDNFILLNPYLSQSDQQVLSQLAIDASQKYDLNSHLWLATSGSSADSQRKIKMVALSQRALVHSAIAVHQWIRATESDRWLQVLPFFHVGGLGIELRARLTQAQLHYSAMEKWNPQLFTQECEQHRITITSLVPTQVFDLVNLQLPAPEKLRVIFVGGGQLSDELYSKARKLGWPLLPSYGMTETASMIACANLESLDQNQAIPQLQILPHARLSTNAEGFIVIESSSLLTLYARNLDEQGLNQEVFDPKLNGRFVSEDCGQIHRDYLQVLGRHSDFIKIGAEATNLLRLREILKKMTLHDQAVLVAIEDQRLGNKLILVSEKQYEKDLDQWIEQFNQQVLPFEKIRDFVLVDKIPVTALGKIQYEKLKSELQEIFIQRAQQQRKN